MADYWNHNTAYHRWILRIAEEREERDALDVGCGDGLLLQRLAPLCRTVTGIEPDATMRAAAGRRLADVSNATVMAGDFTDLDAQGSRFDLIVFVASLHHMDPRQALAKARGLLRPGGELLVVGLAANRTLSDWALSGLALPWVRLGSFLHRESGPDAPVASPLEGLVDIREIAEEIVPGARIRRGLYYRYLLRWTRPSDPAR